MAMPADTKESKKKRKEKVGELRKLTHTKISPIHNMHLAYGIHNHSNF